MTQPSRPASPLEPPDDALTISAGDPSFVSYLAIRQATNALNRLQERYVVNQPTSEIQAYVCAILVRIGRPLKMGDIARFLCVEPQTVTGLVKRMEAKGLVRRVQSTVDRRHVMVDVTDEGRALWQQAMRLTQTVRRQAFASLTVQQHVELASVMIRIRDMALDALGDDPAEPNALMWTIFSEQQMEPFRDQLSNIHHRRKRRQTPSDPG